MKNNITEPPRYMTTRTLQMALYHRVAPLRKIKKGELQKLMDLADIVVSQGMFFKIV